MSSCDISYFFFLNYRLASLVRPKMLRSVHFCEATKAFHERTYRDGSSLTGLETSVTYPTRDEAGNLLSIEYGLSEYENVQNLHVQEMPEKAEVGQLPRSVDVVLNDDLVDKCKPGDRVQIIGVYVAMAGKNIASTNGLFRQGQAEEGGILKRALFSELLLLRLQSHHLGRK